MSLNTSDPEYLKAAGLVSKELGISRHDAARLNKGQFWDVANKAYREGRGGAVGTTRPEGPSFRDSIIEKMQKAEPSGKGKKPTRVADENIPASWGDAALPSKIRENPRDNADSGGGGGGGTLPTIDLELCDGTVVRVYGSTVPT